MTHDLIASMLTKIRNAILVKHKTVKTAYSRVNLAILTILLDFNYINSIQLKFLPASREKNILITLKYVGWINKKSTINSLIRISKSSQRIFAGYRNIKGILHKFNLNQGLAVLSTSSGIMSHPNAIELKKGGEILCYID